MFSQDSNLPDMDVTATANWFLYMYTLDVESRIEIIEGIITNTFGEILKMDSTKKVRILV